MSNFGFLAAEWPDLHKEVSHAERIAVADPRASCFYSRRALEHALTWLYQADDTLVLPYRDDLAALINEATLATLMGPGIRTKMDLIRRQGNAAVHRAAPVEARDAVRVLAELFHIMYWIARNYARDAQNQPAPALSFDQSMIPRPVPAQVRKKRQEELQRQAEDFKQQQEELARLRRAKEDVDAELVRLRGEIKAAKSANATRPDTHDYNEAETRELIIDLLLGEAGWPLADQRDREYPVQGMPASVSESGNGWVDYVLWDDDGKPLGLVEAKRTSRDAAIGQQQAKLYANCPEQMYGQRPVIFYTNGYQTFLWDDLAYPPREVQGFYTKEELRLLIQRRSSRTALAGVAINEEIAGRYYQARAIRRIGEAFEQENRREALLVKATGSGKTRTVIGLVDQLVRANWVKRVLFLADRQALVTQAVNAFKQHLPGVSAVNLLKEKNTPGRVYVSTYPTMRGLINDTQNGVRTFGPGYFDLVIIDEAHRSVYQKYGAIFDYFDSLLVGLTATPKDEIDRNTYRLFALEDGVPTDVYSLDDAVADGYLVAPRTVDVPLKFLRRGITYDELPEEEKEQWDALDWSEDEEVPDRVDPEEVNKFLFNEDTIDKMLQVLMSTGAKVAGGDRLGKTIIFAKNTRHAQFIANRFNKNFPEYRGEFAKVITHQTAYAQSLIDDFSVKDKAPHIAISVDMLDTGIDIPEVVNLVFAKLVRSKTKFWQMIGRGTRLCADLYAPNQDKHGFLVFDLCQNVEFFNAGLARAEGRIQPSLSERLFKQRMDLLALLDEQHPHQSPPDSGTPDGTSSEIGLRWDLAQRLQAEVAGMNLDNIEVRRHWQQVETYRDPAKWWQITPEKHTEITEHLAGLPTEYREDDSSQEAKRFDLTALRLQLAVLNGDPSFGNHREQVQHIAEGLLTQTTIPAVRDQQVLLEELAGEEWWQDVTLPMLETMRRRIRGLVKLLPTTRRAVVYTDFQDELGELSLPELRGVELGTDRSRFEAKIRTYLRSHENELAVQKLRRNRQITTTDLGMLQDIFIEAGYGTHADIDRAAEEHDGFGLFLRSLSGLDREAAATAFDSFQAGRTLSADQYDFLQLLIDYLARNGTIDIEALYDPPFSTLAPTGPDALFGSSGVDQLQEVLDTVRRTARPQEQAS